MIGTFISDPDEVEARTALACRLPIGGTSGPPTPPPTATAPGPKVPRRADDL